MNLLQLESVDEENGVAWTVQRPSTLLQETYTTMGRNVIDHLDAPGHWVSVSKEKDLLLAKEGKPSENLVIPTLQEYFKVKGQVDYDGPKDIPTQNLVLKA